MNRRLVAAAMAGLLSSSFAVSLHASPFAFHHDVQVKTSAAKMISFNVRNDSKDALVVQAGDQQVTINPGKTAKFKLAEGGQLTTVNATEKRAAGSLLATISRQLEGNTLAIS